MNRLLFLSLPLLGLAVSGSAVAQPSKQSDESSADAQALIANCSAHKFETTVQTTVDGKPHASKVKLCGKAGQSDSEWLVTLKDALATVEDNPKMPAEVKGQIAAGLKSQIAIVEAGIAAKGAPTAAAPVVPPLPATPTVAAPAAPLTSPTVATVAVPATPPQPLPRLSLQCYTPGDLGSGGPCTTLTRDTLLTIGVDGALASGAMLRFVHDGDTRGEIALAPMRKGRTVRVKVPLQVCSGGGTTSVDVQLVVPGAQASTGALGPYPLRC